MNEVFLLFLVLVLIYAVECFSFPSISDFILAESLSGVWRVRQPPQFAGSWSRSPVLKFPVPPLYGVCLCRVAPVHISEYGVQTLPDHNEASALVGPGGVMGFSDVKAFYSDGTSVHADEQCLIKVSSQIYAHHLANLLEEIRKCPARKREAKIQEKLEAMFDTRMVQRRLSDYLRHTTPLRRACNVLFFNLFVVVPLGVELFGLAASWAVLLAFLATNTLLVAGLFYRAHALLYPGERESRFTAVAASVLSPPFAMRANDVILRDIFCSFHPLAVIRSVCSTEDFVSVASRAVREAQFSRQPPGFPANISSADKGVEWEQRVRQAIEKCAASSGVLIETLLRSPARQSSGSNSYCPRCLTQYAVRAGKCSDCPHVELVRFPETAA